MLATVFLLVSLAAGLVLAYALPLAMRLEERLAAGLAFGLTAGSLLSLAAVLWLGFSPLTLWLTTLVLAIGTGVGWWLARNRIKPEVTAVLKRARKRQWQWALAVYVIAAAFLSWLFWHAFGDDHGAYYTLAQHVASDWHRHLAEVTGFAYGNALPPEFTSMVGQRLSYPFLINWLSAVLLKGGFALPAAMKVPMVLLMLSTLGLLMAFVRRLAGYGAALLAPLLFFLSGGLGFINFFADLVNSHQPLGYFLTHLPHVYTAGPNSGVLITHLQWINIVSADLIPQRSFIFGLPLVLTILILLYEAVSTRRRFLLLAAGVVGGFLPLIHSHGIVFLGLFGLGLAWFNRRKLPVMAWGWFFLPLAVIALPQLVWLTHGVNSTGFIRPFVGWVSFGDNIIWFWLKNMGLWLPVLGLALWWLRRTNRPLFTFTLAALPVFLLANLIAFQPNAWDNTKLFVYWYAVSIPAVAAWLVWLGHLGRWRQVGVGMLIFILVFSGGLDLWKFSHWRESKAEMYNPAERRLAELVRRQSRDDSVWLTPENDRNVIASLTGRRVVLAWGPWFGSYGINYGPRQADIARMYAGYPEAPELLKRYRVNYVAFWPDRKDRESVYELNRDYFAQRYPVWFEDGAVTVYQVVP